MSQQPVKRPRGRPRKNPVPVENFIDLPETLPVFPPVDYSVFEQKLKVHIYPSFGEEDNGDGGIRRVVEGQLKHLPKFGIEIVPTAAEADVIAAHAVVPSSYVKLYPRKTFVALCHGLYWEEYEWENWALRANAEVIENIRVSDSVIACSEWVANAVRRHTSRNVTVVPHGIDIEQWQGSDSPRDYVLWNKTRPDPVCDPRPMNQVAELLPEVKFISTFGEKAPNIALTGRLEFSEAQKLIQNAGVYLCTTRETFGIGTLEALACGVPVVGFNFGGQKEFIEHEVDGWLVTPGDIEGLARGIRWGLQNRERVAAKCREKAAAFTWEAAASQYADIFRKAYAEKNKPGPRTTILVTNYNLEKYLPDALESVKNQTDEDWECIVVDDASPNPEGRMLAVDFFGKDQRFRLIENKNNVYLAESRNIGIREARGRYILPLDADDMLDPNAVKLLADALDADRSIHVAYGNVKFMEEDGVTPSDYGLTPGHSSWPYPFVHEQQILQRNLLPYCSMYRKTAWEETGGYRRRCRTAEDADFWTRLSSYGYRPKMVTNEDTLIYRNRDGSMSRTNSSDWIHWFPWSKLSQITPAGAVTKSQLPISSLDPIIISVVIPVGPGHEKIVTDAIDSLDAQIFRNWECIVVNDTGGCLDTELPSWVKVINTEGRTGVAHARNVGIAAAKGRLFLPLDADDYLEPEALEMMFNAYKETHDIIYTDFWQTSMDGKEMSIHECDDYDPRLLTGGKRTVNGQVRSGMIHSVTALTPKSVWEEVGGYDEILPAWEDWDFQLAAGDIGICSRRIAAPLFVYRKHTGRRREENHEFFERSKEGIIQKWGKLWQGGKELMACGSCGSGRKSINPQTAWGIQGAQQRSLPNDRDDAVLVKYIGQKLGAVPYRGPSKTTYWFAAGDVKYVLKQDLEMFSKYSEFVVQISDEISYETPTISPSLVAPGQA